MSTPAGTTINTSGLGSDVSGIVSLIQYLTGSGNKNAQNIANVANPWQPVQAAGISGLTNFFANPSAPLQNPAFQSQLDLGLQSAARQYGAAGMGASGNELAGLEQYGQTQAYNAENTYFNQLLNMAGLGSQGPANAANALLGGQQNTAANLAGGIGGVASLISQLLGGQSGAGGGGLVTAIQQLLSGGGSGGLSSIYNVGGNYGNVLNTQPDLSGYVSGSDITDTGGFDLSNWLSGSDLGSGLGSDLSGLLGGLS